MDAHTEKIPRPRAVAREGPVEEGRRGASVEQIEAVYRREAARYARLAAAIAGPQAASDIVQEAFAAALRRRRSWRGDGPLEAWLWRFVLNAAADAGRGRMRRERLFTRLFRSAGPSSSPPAHVDDSLRRPLQQLPPRQRECIVLRYYGDLSYDEIGFVMGIETGTVGALLSNGHAALRAALDREDHR